PQWSVSTVANVQVPLPFLRRFTKVPSITGMSLTGGLTLLYELVDRRVLGEESHGVGPDEKGGGGASLAAAQRPA
ncbi:MAG: hypothetical protein ACREA0_15610, partial [bacterium]